MPQPLSPVGYCRQCGYDLRGLASARCPECNCAFDLANPRTFHRRPRSRWPRRLLVCFGIPLLLAALAYCGLIGWLYMGWQSEADARNLPVQPTRRDCGGVDGLTLSPILPPSLHCFIPHRCRPWLDRISSMGLSRGGEQRPANLGQILSHCHYLNRISLYIRVRTTDVQFISKMSCVTDLQIRGPLDPAAVRLICAMRNLTTLSLGAELPASDYAALAELSNLRELTIIQRTPLDDQMLYTVSRMPQLTKVYLSPRNVFTDGALDCLLKLPNLQSLDLGAATLTDAAADKLARLKTLHYLGLWYTGLSPAAIDRIRTALPNCGVTPPAGQP